MLTKNLTLNIKIYKMNKTLNKNNYLLKNNMIN